MMCLYRFHELLAHSLALPDRFFPFFFVVAFFRHHKEKRKKAVWQRETNIGLSTKLSFAKCLNSQLNQARNQTFLEGGSKFGMAAQMKWAL